MLNVAVRKKLLPSNPCSSVEFPVVIKRLFKPHYVTWSEQQRIERHSPQLLRNIVRILTETGLRINKELLPMRKDHLDIANTTVWISGLQDGEWCGGSPAHADCRGCVSKPTFCRWTR